MNFLHVLESQQFSLPTLIELFGVADEMDRVLARGGTQDYHDKIMASIFYDFSTRTRFSFQSAMYRLGGQVISTEQAKMFSSFAGGESLEDTIRVVNNYADVIVIRHNEIGGAQRAAAVSNVPVINAGDGKGGQHPTQALLDLYTIYKEVKSIQGVKVAMVGDLITGRTVRSLTYLLGKFERVKIYFVAPPGHQITKDILEYLDRHNVWYTLESDLSKVIPEVDVIYSTRIEPGKKESDKKINKIISKYYIDAEMMKIVPKNTLIMHPLPRFGEISPEVDSDPRAAYFRQTRNGVLIRMAIFATVLGR